MSDPKISVIIPFRDAYKNIERAVSSVLSQTFRDFELIVINDGSTDGSPELVEKIKDERLKLIHLPAGGNVVALNEGLYSSRGEFIALMDCYDSARNDRLELQYKTMLQNPDVSAVASRVKYTHESEDNNIRPYIDWTNQIINEKDIYQKRFVNSTLLQSTLLFRKELISRFGLFEDGEFPEDYEMFLRWMNQGIRVCKLEEELTNWYDDIQRLSRRHIRYNSSAAIKIKSMYFNRWYKSYFRTPPDILVWGSKDVTRKQIGKLESEGFNIAGYINTNGYSLPWLNDRPVFSIDEIPPRTFIIYFVEQFLPVEVPAQLSEKGLEEGLHFIAMS